MEWVVDVQGFKKPINEFVLKEFAVIPVHDKKLQPLAFIFQPPCTWDSLPVKYQRINAWLTRNFHGLSWDSGDLPYDAAKEIIRNILLHACTIYVKGVEKKEWLTSFMGESMRIVNLEDLECPSLMRLREQTPPTAYPHHHSKINCAGENVKLLRNWVLQPCDRSL